MKLFNKYFEAYDRGLVLGKSMGMDWSGISCLQAQFLQEEQERERKQELNEYLENMYALAKYLHAHNAPINEDGLAILKRHGYDVSEFED